MSNRVKIRKGSLTEDLYLNRQGEWVEWKDAAWFNSQDAAIKFAVKMGIGENYGLF